MKDRSRQSPQGLTAFTALSWSRAESPSPRSLPPASRRGLFVCPRLPALACLPACPPCFSPKTSLAPSAPKWPMFYPSNKRRLNRFCRVQKAFGYPYTGSCHVTVIHWYLCVFQISSRCPYKAFKPCQVSRK
jgi:hypothetical protein